MKKRRQRVRPTVGPTPRKSDAQRRLEVRARESIQVLKARLDESVAAAHRAYNDELAAFLADARLRRSHAISRAQSTFEGERSALVASLNTEALSEPVTRAGSDG